MTVPVPTTRDRSTTEHQLGSWLRDHLPGAAQVRVTIGDTPAGTGFSGETLLFTAAWTAGGQECSGDFVARIRPTDYSLYQTHDLETQRRVLEALAGTDVPVPRIIGAQDESQSPLGQPFIVMERVRGRAPADSPPFSVGGWLAEAAPEDQSRLCRSALEVLARIHAVDWAGRGLGFLLTDRVSPVGVEAAMAHDEQFLTWVADGRSLPEFEAAARWLRSHLPEERERVLNWGDARLGNMLFHDFRPTAVLDWEMVTLGAREADLGWWLFFNRLHSEGISRRLPPGFPDEEGTVERYEQVTGHTVSDLHFYLVRSALRGGLLLRRYADMLVASGALSPDASRGPYTPAVRVLEGLMSS